MKSIFRKIYYILTVKQRYIIRRILFFPVDIFSDRNKLIPPKGMIYTGGGDFISAGNEFFNYFKKYGVITPNSSILDIGSGIGRMAIPFTSYLNKNGAYKGFDIVEQGVKWCTKNITKKFPNFVFTYTPLKNDLYNLTTNNLANNFTFPYRNEEFDFVFLTSVFTHMLPEDVDQYLNEIKRVLKPNKKCLATFFVLDKTNKELMANSSKNFKYNKGNYALMTEKVKEANVAYDNDFLFELIKQKGFEIEYYLEGNWSGKTENTFSYQDIIILKNK